MKEIIDDFFKWFISLFEPLFELIDKNQKSPILWILLVVIGMLICRSTYNILNKKG